MSVTTRTSGPIFDGRAAAAVAAYVEHTERTVAEQGVDVVRSETRVFRNPTGTYRSRIQVDGSGGGRRIHDGGIVYGPWLAGTSRRNQSTRFKGYSHWPIAAARLNARAENIAERELPPYLRRMGG